MFSLLNIQEDEPRPAAFQLVKDCAGSYDFLKFSFEADETK